MKNEFVENNEVDSAIRAVYQAMYAKSDKGAKSGETTLTITAPSKSNPESLAEGIKQYFDNLYANATLKKYFISIEVLNEKLLINFKWGHHAIVANQAA